MTETKLQHLYRVFLVHRWSYKLIDGHVALIRTPHTPEPSFYDGLINDWVVDR
jgi:hypothetical protein